MFAQWMKVSRGFRLVYIGLVLFVVAFLGGILAVALASGAFARGKEPGGLTNVIAIGMLLCILAASITGLIGRFLCMAIPAKAGSARGLIITSVALEVTAMTFGALNQVRHVGGLQFDPAVTEILQMGWVLLSVGSSILFLLFTKAAALFIRERDLADKASSVLWLWAAMFGCYVLVTALALIMLKVGPGSGGSVAGCSTLILLLVSFILAVKALIRYVGLTRDMSEAIDDYARSARRAQRNKRKRERKRRQDEDEDEEDEDE
jgi:hypothetical protein